MHSYNDNQCVWTTERTLPLNIKIGKEFIMYSTKLANEDKVRIKNYK